MGELDRLSARELIQRALTRHTLSPASASALQETQIARQIQQALERSYTVERARKLLLITMMPDDSGSMQARMQGSAITKQDSVIEGHNELLEAMRDGGHGKRTMLQTRYLNGTVLNPFSPLDKCQPLNRENYRCVLGTPLYEQTLVTLGAVMAKAEELADRVTNVHTATLIMTDAESTEHRAEEHKRAVAGVINDMRQLGNHIVAGMGFAEGDDSVFRQVFTEMGIDSRHIFTATSREEILQAFSLFRQSALELTARSTTVRRIYEG